MSGESTQRPVTPPVEGHVDPRFAAVRDAFADVLAGQPVGASVAAWHDGDWVVDLWGGWTDPAGRRAWRPDSLVQAYSVIKPFVAVCALLLVERGRLELDAPVQRYWPEFRAPASVRQVLSHQAGVVALDAPAPTEAFFDWPRLTGLLEVQEPLWEPGTAIGESALLYGHLVGELVRRTDGRPFGRFLREEVCGPLGLDVAVGLKDAELARVVDLHGLDPAFREQNAASKPDLYRRAIGNPPGAQDGGVVNGAAWRRAEVPAVNGYGTARGYAGLFAALMSGRVLSPALLIEATTVQASGTDLVFGNETAWGLGVALEPDGYGLGGLGGSMGWASTAGGYAFAFVTGTVGDHERATLVENALRDSLGLPPLDP